MYLVRVSEETRIKLTMFKEAFSFRDGQSKDYNDVIKELIDFYGRHAKNANKRGS
jgi:hypothetical protein